MPAAVFAARRGGVVFVSFAAVLWGTVGLAATVAYRRGVDPLEVALWRLTIGSVASLPFIVGTRRRRPARLQGRDLPRIVLVGVGLAAYQGCFFVAMDHAGVSLATLLTLGLAPVLVAGVSTLAIKERPGTVTWLAIGLALIGLAALVGIPTRAPRGLLLGAVFAFGSALGYTGMIVATKAVGSGIGADRLAVVSFAVASLVLLPAAALTGTVRLSSDPLVITALTYIGVGPTALAYRLFFTGLERISAPVTSVLTLFEPLVATCLAVALLGERLGTANWFGAAVLMTAVVLAGAARDGGERSPSSSTIRRGSRPPAKACASLSVIVGRVSSVGAVVSAGRAREPETLAASQRPRQTDGYREERRCQRQQRFIEHRSDRAMVDRGSGQSEQPDGGALAAAGARALETGDWPAARDSFHAALEVEETAEALSGAGEALWWLGDLDGSITYRERAYSAFRRRPDPEQAFLVALFLCLDYRAHVGNVAASAGWLARAARLVQVHKLEGMRGWLAFARAHDAADAVAGEQWAREALDAARTSGDLDLELCALSQLGALLIQQGRIEEGVGHLDEAMAGSLAGEGGSLDTVVLASCNMMVSCTSCADFERAVQWVHAADRFTRRYGCPFLYAECRTVYGEVLLATGDWRQAEEELQTAVASSRGTVPQYHAQAVAALAALRLAQGRVEEAQRLVAGIEDHAAAVPVVARVHLLQGRPEAAAATARRRLQVVGEDRIGSGILLELLGEAEIAQGDSEAAAERGRALAELGVGLNCSVHRARGERLLGRALAAAGEVEAAREPLDAAVTSFGSLQMPYETARTRALLALALAELLPEVAVAEARTALSVFDDLGASSDADAVAALLRRLGVSAARARGRSLETLTEREREVLALLGEGLSNPGIAGRLFISRKTVEHHVARVLSKLGLRNRAEAAAAAVRQGLASASK